MKTNLLSSSIIIIILVTCGLASCKSIYPIRYEYNPVFHCDSCSDNEIRQILINSDEKAIILQNDSIIRFWKRHGGLSSVISSKYKLINNELNVNLVDTYGRVILDSSNRYFLYNKDSLINQETNEKYYNQKWLDKIKIK